MSTTDNTNLSLDDLKAVVHKTKEESRREGYTAGASDALAAFCRAIGIPAIYVSRPSLWATPLDRTRTLQEYTDETGIEVLEEVADLVRYHFETQPPATTESLWETVGPLDVSPVVMPQSALDVQALLDIQEGSSDE